jgi:hypothetical protein
MATPGLITSLAVLRLHSDRDRDDQLSAEAGLIDSVRCVCAVGKGAVRVGYADADAAIHRGNDEWLDTAGDFITIARTPSVGPRSFAQWEA